MVTENKSKTQWKFKYIDKNNDGKDIQSWTSPSFRITVVRDNLWRDGGGAGTSITNVENWVAIFKKFEESKLFHNAKKYRRKERKRDRE